MKTKIAVYLIGILILSSLKVALADDFFFTVNTGNTAGASTDAELATTFQMLSDLGCTQTKWSFGWQHIEDPRGVYDWTKTDYIATLAQQYNMSIILFSPQVSVPKWALKEGQTANVPRNPGEYANFIYQVLNRYKGSMTIQYVEIFNEIAHGTTDGVNPPFGPHWDDTAAYAVEVGNTIYDKVHDNFPDVKVGPMSLTQPHGLGSGMTAENDVKPTFMSAYFSATTKPKMDFLSIHNYPHYGPTQTGSFTYATQYNMMELYRDLLDSYGYNDTPLLITEGAIGTSSWVN